MNTVTVKTPSKTYPVFIGEGLLKDAGMLALRRFPAGKAAIVTDDIVDGLYAETLEDSLNKAGFETIKFVFPHGESSKNTDTLIALLNFLAENRLTQSDAVFALGGGVVGDLAGFAAAVFLRGIRLVQAPTTLLAAVDSSVGGKTAIDLAFGKNMAGAFYQPELVVCDCDTLKTLNRTETANGFAEIIKYGVICDAELFEQLKAPEKLNIREVITRCVEIKRDIVGADERDTGLRHLLNLGHTFGHAVEQCSGFTVPHGSAVAVGLSLIAAACVKKRICYSSCRKDITAMLERYELPTVTDFSEEALFEAMLSDKKRSAGKITLVVPHAVGESVLKTVTLDEAHEFLKLGLSV